MKTRVYIVDDSRVSQELLKYIVNSDPELAVIGTAINGEEALQWLKSNSTDVITMDLLMPGLDGFEVTRRIMETRPIPIVVISAAYSAEHGTQGFQAMEAGALAILEKPAGIGDTLYARKAQEIINTIKMVSEIKLIKRKRRENSDKPTIDTDVLAQYQSIEAVGIGASLGGPVALATILAKLSSTFPVPVFIVQHIAKGFTESLAKWLQGFTTLKVTLAQDGELARPGYCYLAPNEGHLEITFDHYMKIISSPTDRLQPSVSRLFRSMAESYGSRAIGVILTGMGIDGARDLLLMRQKGAFTIAQNEESCTMFSMPREAIALGAARSVLSLDQIGHVLASLSKSQNYKIANS